MITTSGFPTSLLGGRSRKKKIKSSQKVTKNVTKQTPKKIKKPVKVNYSK